MKIACLQNGPYYLLPDEKPAPTRGLRRQDGSSCQSTGGVALCRCGGSASKPFCDGTHGRNSFSDRNTADAAANRRIAYVGKGITIFDNRAICAHAGFCTDGLKKVFRMLESNLEAGSQPIPEDRSKLRYGVSVTDPCIDWRTTEELLRRARNSLRPLLAQRAR